jgi:hypothetical protein
MGLSPNKVVQGRLYVFDAALLNLVWESAPFSYAKFVPPTIADGHVFVATSDHVVNVYGLGATPPPRFPAGAGTAALAIDANTLDVFAVDEGGTLQHTRYANNPWSPWGAVGGSPFAKLAPGAPVAAVSRAAGHIDVFVTDVNGAIETNWWDAASDGGRWDHAWQYAMPPGTVPPGAQIAAVGRTQNHLDVYAIDDAGDVATTWWDGSAPVWSGVERIMGGLGGQPGGGVTAIARSSGHLDLFAVDSTGAVMTTWWDQNPAGGQWTNEVRVTNGATVPRGGSISVTARVATHMDLAFIDNAENLATTWWDAATGWAFAAPEISAGGGLSAGGAVQILSRFSTHLDVFAVATDGTLVTRWWDAAPGWSNATGTPPQSAASAPGFADAPVSFGAVSRSATQLDVFSVDAAGKLTSSWWNQASVCSDMNDAASALPAWVMTPCWQNQPWVP